MKRAARTMIAIGAIGFAAHRRGGALGLRTRPRVPRKRQRRLPGQRQADLPRPDAQDPDFRAAGRQRRAEPDLTKPHAHSKPVPSFFRQAVLQTSTNSTGAHQGHFYRAYLTIAEHHGTHIDAPSHYVNAQETVEPGAVPPEVPERADPAGPDRTRWSMSTSAARAGAARQQRRHAQPAQERHGLLGGVLQQRHRQGHRGGRRQAPERRLDRRQHRLVALLHQRRPCDVAVHQRLELPRREPGGHRRADRDREREGHPHQRHRDRQPRHRQRRGRGRHRREASRNSYQSHVRGLQRGWKFIENATNLGALASAKPDSCTLVVGALPIVRGSGSPARVIAMCER